MEMSMIFSLIANGRNVEILTDWRPDNRSGLTMTQVGC